MPGGPDLTMEEIFPPIEKELGPYRHYFKGKVLNAGAGRRDISSLVEGTLFNQDIQAAPHVDVVGPLHQIPVEDAFFDTIICNAVLEHVENPDEVMAEFHRVCRPGGVLYLTVPFMQPEHLDPTDYQRYTLPGLERLVAAHGFEVTDSGGVHSVYVTLAWIAREWLAHKRTFAGAVLRRVLYPYLRRRCRDSEEYVHSLASAYRVIGVKS
jgi:ubiquinone/menaquinone biosynthesis C-methylase UbiE